MRYASFVGKRGNKKRLTNVTPTLEMQGFRARQSEVVGCLLSLYRGKCVNKIDLSSLVKRERERENKQRMSSGTPSRET